MAVEPGALMDRTAQDQPQPVRARSLVDLLLLPEAKQDLVHWLMRQGESGLEQVAKACTAGDRQAALDLLDSLVEEGFVQVMEVAGVARYRVRVAARPGRSLPRSIWQALYESLADVFDHEGTAVELGGNRPLLLADPGAVWLVRSGVVHLFTVALRDGAPAGSRRFLAGAQPGDTLFGLGTAALGAAAGAGAGAEAAPEGHPEADPVGLIAVGTPGTLLRRLDRARLQELCREPRHTEQVALVLGDWITRLAGTLPTEPPPRQARILAPGQPTPLVAGQHAQTPGGVLWTTVTAGHVSLAGRPALRLDAAAGAVPVAGRLWLTADGPSQVQAVETTAWLASDPAWTALDRFHRLLLRALALSRQTAAELERARLAARAEADRESVTGAVIRLAGVLEPPSAAAHLGGEGDALLVACRLVGAQLGIAIQPPARSERSGQGADPLAIIARASHIRIRRVALRDDWWRRDHGPLLAYRQTGEPVALLPDGPGRYQIHDPASGGRQLLTPGAAATLDSFGVVLYRSFPQQALTALQVVRFGTHGIGRDLRRLLLLGAAGGLLSLLVPALTGVIFNSILPTAARGDLLTVVLALAVAAFAAAVFQGTRGLAFLRIEGRMVPAVQAAVWDRLLSLPVPFFRGYTAGDLASRAMGIDAIQQLLTGSVAGALLAGLLSLFSWGLLFTYDVRLALWATLLGLVLVAATVGGNLVQLRYQRRLQEVQGRLSGTVLQLVAGMPKLRVASAERRAFAAWARGFTEQKRLALKAKVFGLTAFHAAFPVVSALVLFAVVSRQRATLSMGDFLAFLAAFQQFTQGALGACGAAMGALQAVPVYERAQPILQTPVEADAVQADPGELAGEIEISHISFRYTPEAPLTLKDISIRVRPGQFVAIVGPSGQGKSTLLRLLLGFERPAAGAIYYDGQDLAGLDVRAVRRQIGAVLQHGRLQQGDIFGNIVGASNLTLDDAWEAARLAGLDEEIRQMPMGMQTVVAEGLSTLSGGQRQRLLIARAIVHRPRILLFDEATSALDNQTQALISRSLEGLQATRIVIAHRLSTVINADCIYVMQGGSIVQTGTYEELVQQPGPFRELVRRQLA